MVENWEAYLEEAEEDGFRDRIHLNQRTGRPLGDEDFVSRLETMTGLVLRKRRPGPKTKSTPARRDNKSLRK
jgi:putative transposase